MLLIDESDKCLNWFKVFIYKELFTYHVINRDGICLNDYGEGSGYVMDQKNRNSSKNQENLPDLENKIFWTSKAINFGQENQEIFEWLRWKELNMSGRGNVHFVHWAALKWKKSGHLNVLRPNLLFWTKKILFSRN